jgi:tetratricopeptide (TPR) repeat protein
MRPMSVLLWIACTAMACASTAYARSSRAPAGTASEAVTRFVSPNALEHFIRAGLFVEAQQFELAAAEYHAALSFDRGSAYLHFRFGEALERLGRLSQARGEFQTAVDLDPTLADAQENLTRLLHARNVSSAN